MGLVNNGIVYVQDTETKDVIRFFEGALEEIHIPTGVKALPNYTLYYNSAVKKIFVPPSVTTVASYFAEGSSVTEIVLDTPLLTDVGSNFARSSSIVRIKLPESLEKADRELLRYCSKLKVVVFNRRGSFSFTYGFLDTSPNAQICAYRGSNAINQAGSRPYYYISEEADLEASEGVVTGYTGTEVYVAIPEKAGNINVSELRGTFADNVSVERVMILGNTYRIGDYTFSGCTALTKFDMYDDTATEYGAYSFCGCASLTDMYFSPILEIIGEYAFGGCTALAKISLPDSLKFIGTGAFDECSALADITLENGFDAVGLDLSATAAFSEATAAAMFNALKDRTDEEPNTVKLGADNIARLPESVLAVATAKNWNII